MYIIYIFVYVNHVQKEANIDLPKFNQNYLKIRWKYKSICLNIINMTKNDIYRSMNTYIFIKYDRHRHEMLPFSEGKAHLENKIQPAVNAQFSLFISSLNMSLLACNRNNRRRSSKGQVIPSHHALNYFFVLGHH